MQAHMQAIARGLLLHVAQKFGAMALALPRRQQRDVDHMETLRLPGDVEAAYRRAIQFDDIEPAVR